MSYELINIFNKRQQSATLETKCNFRSNKAATILRLIYFNTVVLYKFQLVEKEKERKIKKCICFQKVLRKLLKYTYFLRA